jgi:Enterobacter phage Enc34, ssDNA-binding protein
MNTQTQPTKTDFSIRLDNVRLSYPQLFQAKSVEEGGKLKYSATFILRKKEHAAVIQKLEKMIERCALEKFGKKVTLKNIPLHDGNEKEDSEGYGDEVMYINAKNDTRPAVVDQRKAPLTADDNKVYAGCYVNAFIELFAYKHKTGGMGVSASLRAVQFAKDGESLGGAAPVDTDKVFDDVDGEDDASNY